MEMAIDYLPIGSVVLLEGGTKKLMITGFCTVPEESPEEMYDYCGCVFPEGVLSSDETYVFDHNQIQDVLFIGYENDEQKSFKESLTDTIGNMYKDVMETVVKQENNEKDESVQPEKTIDFEEIERL